MANEKNTEEQPKERKPLTGQAWQDAFEASKRAAESRDHIYPEGYDIEFDRASIYTKDEDDPA